MRVLGIDHGDRHVGLALSDPLLITAQPLASYALTGREDVDRRYFQDIVARHDVGEIVLGDPLLMDGSTGTRSGKARSFAAWLKKVLGLPVVLLDERLTTRQALKDLDDDRLRGKKKKVWEDQVAAVIILSTYLERKRGEARGPEGD